MPGWQEFGGSGVESRFEALRTAALTPLVGRDEEIELLLPALAAGALSGAGQMVLLAGDPGIGKSRLVRKWRSEIQAEPHLRLRYFCSPHQSGQCAFPVIGQLGTRAGFERDDNAETKLAKLEALLAQSAAGIEDHRRSFPTAVVAGDGSLLRLPNCHAGAARADLAGAPRASSKAWRAQRRCWWCSRTCTGSTRPPSNSST